MDTSLQGSEGKGAPAAVGAPFVRGQAVRLFGGGRVGLVEFEGVSQCGEHKLCVRLSPGWRHFAAPAELQPVDEFTAQRIVRHAQRQGWAS